MRRLAAPILLAVLALAGCGSTHRPLRGARAALAPSQACSQAANGRGAPGICAPRVLGLGLPHAAPRVSVSGPSFLDLSNNDPCYCGAEIKAQGHVGLIVKANQGTGFIDSTAVGMVRAARAAGLAVGVYDFDQDYSLAEAHVFVARARAAGILPSSANTFPLYFDVEYGSFSYPGLLAQIRYVRSLGYRVGIYTGGWYWSPHAGCQWPSGITAWLSGYPVAVAPCGLPGGLFNTHQFTSTPVDQSVFLGPGTFTAFVNATPVKPKPNFTIYPVGPVRIFGQNISERRTVERWRSRGCQNPVKRSVCATTRLHLQWFAGRLQTLSGGHWGTVRSRQLKWGQRHYRLERILNG